MLEQSNADLAEEVPFVRKKKSHSHESLIIVMWRLSLIIHLNSIDFYIIFNLFLYKKNETLFYFHPEKKPSSEKQQ
jgi:hypothetical protein